MTIKFFANYRQITKCKETGAPAQPDIWALLNYLAAQYGDAFKKKILTEDGNDIAGDAIILVNGRNIRYLNWKCTPLCESDVVSIFPLVAGG